MDSKDEESICQCGSSAPTSKCQGNNWRAVCEPLNRKSMTQLSGSFSAFKREEEAGDTSNSGHMAFSSPIVSRTCWVWLLNLWINSWRYLFLLPFDEIGCHLRNPFCLPPKSEVSWWLGCMLFTTDIIDTCWFMEVYTLTRAALHPWSLQVKSAI